MEKLVGRVAELKLLRSLKDRNRSDFVAVFGRRRVGKTFLIRSAYAGGPFVLDKRYADQLREKVELFKTATQTRKAVFLTMISTYGLARTGEAGGLVQNELTMDALFG